MKSLLEKKSLEEFSDRELLLFILSNQVTLFRQTKYLMEAITKDEKATGTFGEVFMKLTQDADDILEQAEEYLEKENKDDI